MTNSVFDVNVQNKEALQQVIGSTQHVFHTTSWASVTAVKWDVTKMLQMNILLYPDEIRKKQGSIWTHLALSFISKLSGWICGWGLEEFFWIPDLQLAVLQHAAVY